MNRKAITLLVLLVLLLVGCVPATTTVEKEIVYVEVTPTFRPTVKPTKTPAAVSQNDDCLDEETYRMATREVNGTIFKSGTDFDYEYMKWLDSHTLVSGGYDVVNGCVVSAFASSIFDLDYGDPTKAGENLANAGVVTTDRNADWLFTQLETNCGIGVYENSKTGEDGHFLFIACEGDVSNNSLQILFGVDR